MRQRQRLLWLGIFSCALLVLAVAGWLVPDARGFGTHTQLGLPPCGFRALTSLPCPACGLTTAFAHSVRGELWLGSAANLIGVVLCLLTIATLPVSMWAAVRAVPLALFARRMYLSRWLLTLLALTLVHWLIKLALILGGSAFAAFAVTQPGLAC